MKLYLVMFTRLKCWWFCLRWASYLGRYRSQVPQEGPGNASRGLLFSEGRGHSAVTSCQLQQVNVIHHAPVNEQNIELLAKLFSRHPSMHKLYLLVFYIWVNYFNRFLFFFLLKMVFFPHVCARYCSSFRTMIIHHFVPFFAFIILFSLGGGSNDIQYLFYSIFLLTLKMNFYFQL